MNTKGFTRIGLVVASMALCVTPRMATAQAACTAGTLDSYLSLAQGCSVGSIVFTNFTATLTGQGPLTSAGQVTLTPFSAGDTVGFFEHSSAPLQASLPAPAGGSSYQSLVIRATPLGVATSGSSIYLPLLPLMFVQNSATYGTNVTAGYGVGYGANDATALRAYVESNGTTSTHCVTSTSTYIQYASCPSTPFLTLAYDGSSTLQFTETADAPVGSYTSPPTASISGGAFGIISPAAVVVTTTPEPSSVALLGTGLLTVVPIVRRRQRRP